MVYVIVCPDPIPLMLSLFFKTVLKDDVKRPFFARDRSDCGIKTVRIIIRRTSVSSPKSLWKEVSTCMYDSS